MNRKPVSVSRKGMQCSEGEQEISEGEQERYAVRVNIITEMRCGWSVSG
jgi:hypothetical protein